MHQAVVILIALLQLGQHDPKYVALFTPLEYRYTGGAYKDELFKYRLFVPPPTGPAEKKPLIVWLHGAGESGQDNVAQLGWLFEFFFVAPWERERYPFYFLAVQCPADNPDWTRINPAAGDDMVNVVAAVLQKTMSDYLVDPQRVYLVGISNGGTGCWELASRHPELFAAIVPMASRGMDSSRIKPLVNIPVWTFHNIEDDTSPIQYVQNTVDELKKVGGNVHLSELHGKSINCWSAAFSEFNLLDWLLLQRRGQSSLIAPPGTIVSPKVAEQAAPSPGALQAPGGWLWWQIVLQTVVLIAPPLMAWRALRYFRRRLPSGIIQD